MKDFDIKYQDAYTCHVMTTTIRASDIDQAEGKFFRAVQGCKILEIKKSPSGEKG